MFAQNPVAVVVRHNQEGENGRTMATEGTPHQLLGKFLPAIFKEYILINTKLWTAAYYLQNPNASPITITTNYFPDSGHTINPQIQVLSSAHLRENFLNQGAEFNLPSDNYVAELNTIPTNPLITGAIHYASDDADAMGIRTPTAGQHDLILPFIKTIDQAASQVYVFNPSNTSADLQVTFYGGNGIIVAPIMSFTLASGEGQFVALPTFIGSAWVSASQPVNATVYIGSLGDDGAMFAYTVP